MKNREIKINGGQMKKGQYTPPVQKKIELEWQKSDFGQDILA